MFNCRSCSLLPPQGLSVSSKGGVLEDTFWSPWLWPRSLKSSKIALSSARGQHYFSTAEISLENARNLAKNLQRPFFWFPQVEIAWKKIFEDLFRLKKCLKTFFLRSPEKNFEDLFFSENTYVCVLGLERVCPWPWPRNFFVFLALASSLVSSTPPLVSSLQAHFENWPFLAMAQWCIISIWKWLSIKSISFCFRNKLFGQNSSVAISVWFGMWWAGSFKDRMQ